MKDINYMETCLKVVFAVTIIAAVVAYMVHPNTREQITAAVKEQKQIETEARFFVPTINTGTGNIIVDRKTGVCYYWRYSGYGGGMTVLVDADGKPVIWEGNYEDEE